MIESIPKGVNIRINRLSGTERIFEESKEQYDLALQRAGHPEDKKLKYLQPDTENVTSNAINRTSKRTKRRNRHCIWFCPPYNKQVESKIGQEFFKILDECFKDSHLKQVFNRNTVKLGYRTTKNLEQLITHNNKRLIRRFLKDREQQNKKTCNCRMKDSCPLEGNCAQNNVLYEAQVFENNGDSEAVGVYYGVTEDFKKRFRNHKKSFNNPNYKNETELSIFIWAKRNIGVTCTVRWKIIKKASTYKSGSHMCRLCLLEKIKILSEKRKRNNKLINDKDEFCKKCPHKIKATI